MTMNYQPMRNTKHNWNPPNLEKGPPEILTAEADPVGPTTFLQEEFDDTLNAPCPFHKDAHHNLRDCTVLKKELNASVEYKRPHHNDYRRDGIRRDNRRHNDRDDRDNRHHDDHHRNDRDHHRDDRDDRDRRHDDRDNH
ncbi:splicing factor U2af large subunit A-like [Setaria italica]|uniref:splicing factor U2af large subunit A-like n=1 Tax=Setaria italica TaxID=4555 RepID=UPI000350CD29|nr:splicing factor U2af large subunit A-like [Setaria italica]